MKEQTSAAVFRMLACGKHTPPDGAAARGGIQKKRTPGFPDVRLFSVSRCSKLVYIELSYYFVPTAVLKKERSGLRD